MLVVTSHDCATFVRCLLHYILSSSRTFCGDLDTYTDDVLVSAFGDVIESVADSSSVNMTVRCTNVDHRFVLGESFIVQASCDVDGAALYEYYGDCYELGTLCTSAMAIVTNSVALCTSTMAV